MNRAGTQVKMDVLEDNELYLLKNHQADFLMDKAYQVTLEKKVQIETEIYRASTIVNYSKLDMVPLTNR